MKNQNTLIAAVAIVLSGLPLAAQENPAPQQPPQQAPVHRPVAGMFGLLDTNHDGSVDAAEIDKAAEALRKMDRNGDGKSGPMNSESQAARKATRIAPLPQSAAVKPPRDWTATDHNPRAMATINIAKPAAMTARKTTVARSRSIVRSMARSRQ